MSQFVRQPELYCCTLPSRAHVSALPPIHTPIGILDTHYSGASDKGPSEIGTTSLQRTLVAAAPC